jgi:hypothetical protein
MPPICLNCESASLDAGGVSSGAPWQAALRNRTLSWGTAMSYAMMPRGCAWSLLIGFVAPACSPGLYSLTNSTMNSVPWEEEADLEDVFDGGGDDAELSPSCTCQLPNIVVLWPRVLRCHLGVQVLGAKSCGPRLGGQVLWVQVLGASLGIRILGRALGSKSWSASRGPTSWVPSLGVQVLGRKSWEPALGVESRCRASCRVLCGMFKP